MAFWKEDNGTQICNDPSRPKGKGEIVKYGCDTPADVKDLPGPDPKIRGSSAFVLTPAEFWKLGSTGWVKVG
jgi:hypothetical protein